MNGKLVVAWIVEDDEDVWPLSAKSVSSVADVMLVIDGNHDSTETTRYHRPESFKGEFIVIDWPYAHEEKGANGKQRLVYLDYLKKHYAGDWCLVLDADEFVDVQQNIIQTINTMEKEKFVAGSPFMRHLIRDLAWEDATEEKHFVPGRLFKINEHLYYDEVEHPVLKGWENFGRASFGSDFVIWHLAYAREVFRTHKKFLNHVNKSNIHTRSYLDSWYHAHLFSGYPVRPVRFEELPEVLIEQLDISKDFMYFKDRRLEVKHFEDAKTWKDFFGTGSALEVGCGLGHRVHAMDSAGIDASGFELSQWAVDNCPYKELPIKQGDVLDVKSAVGKYNLVLAYDVLEHLEETDVPKALKNMHSWSSKWVLISVPVIGDPNLERDHTHKTKKSRDWWLRTVTEAGFRIIETPETFHYRTQLIVAEKI